MVKTISGARYDTSTAKKISGIVRGSGPDEIRETLYRKKTGEYFLHGEGGPRTRYAIPEGAHAWGWGSLIRPLSLSEAKVWANENIPEEFDEIFGDPGNERTNLNIRISKAAHEKLKNMAAESGKSMSAIIESYILDR